MSTAPHYRTELKELIKVYDYEEVANALGVTIRSLYNYTNEKNPMAANKNVIKKISETFAKHQRGEPINKIEVPKNGQDVQEKYVELLEKQLANKESTETELKQLREQILTSRSIYDRTLRDVHAYLQVIYLRSVEHFAKTEKANVDLVRNDMDTHLRALLDAD